MCKDSLLALDGTASVSNIRREDLGQLIKLRGVRAALDLDLGAVHVHLAVSLDVEPAPSEQRLATGRERGDLKVPFKLEGASSHVRLDHTEGLAVIVAERDLAGASTVVVSGRKFHVVALAGGVVGNGAPGGVLMVASAGEVGSCVWMP